MQPLPGELTSDDFLNGALSVLQPRTGYRAATDPVLLAAAVPARPGQKVLELGCGAGVASLCLLHRVHGLDVDAVERQADYADLARRNAERNGLRLTVHTADLALLPVGLRQRSFDHVMANPPFFRPGDGTPAQDAGRESALREDTPLAVWIDAGLRRLAPEGWLTLIILAERLGDVLAGLSNRAGSVSVLPVAARAGRPAGRIIIRARKGGRAPLRLLSPLVLHDGAAHEKDGDDHSAAARRILREGCAISRFDE